MNTDRICANCKHYCKGETANDDECRHEKAYRGGVRVVDYFRCGPMLIGVCERNKLFEPAITTESA